LSLLVVTLLSRIRKKGVSMTSHPLACSMASSSHRTKLFLGTVCAVLLATATAEAGKSYKGAEVDSMKAYKYGRIELRMRMIRGSGLLSTFFTFKTGSELAGAFWEEIDIEVFGKEDAKVWQSNLMTGENPKTHSEEYYRIEKSLADDYHTYTIEWTPEYVRWLFDGTEMRKTVGEQALELTTPHTLRFNVWSSEVAAWAGEFDESALPAYQFVNWIKYYRYENGNFVWD
jgi:endo-1,3-1,4-beta-glycanase ExoK